MSVASAKYFHQSLDALRDLRRLGNKDLFPIFDRLEHHLREMQHSSQLETDQNGKLLEIREFLKKNVKDLFISYVDSLADVQGFHFNLSDEIQITQWNKILQISPLTLVLLRIINPLGVVRMKFDIDKIEVICDVSDKNVLSKDSGAKQVCRRLWEKGILVTHQKELSSLEGHKRYIFTFTFVKETNEYLTTTLGKGVYCKIAFPIVLNDFKVNTIEVNENTRLFKVEKSGDLSVLTGDEIAFDEFYGENHNIFHLNFLFESIYLTFNGVVTKEKCFLPSKVDTNPSIIYNNDREEIYLIDFLRHS